MTSNIVTANQSDSLSPFDSIRRYRDDGSEYWSARELMAVLTYTKWQMFKSVIDTAKENIETVDSNSSRHFLLLEVKSLGRNAIDFELSRLACYHVALASDSRGKDAVKMAKHYFVVKTREAEIVIPQQNDRLRELELINENMRLEMQRMGLIDSMASLHGLSTTFALLGREGAIVEVEKPTIEVIDDRHNQQTTYKGQTCAQLKDYMKKRFGITFKSGADVQRILEEIECKFGVSLLGNMPRSVPTFYIPEENSAKAIEYLRDVKNWQMLLGQSA